MNNEFKYSITNSIEKNSCWEADSNFANTVEVNNNVIFDVVAL
jgi:hypothetical protein